MTALGLFSFYNSPGVRVAKTLTTTASYGNVVMADTATAPDDVKKTTGAGVTAIEGVITTPQGDPNNSGLFAIGDVVDVAQSGTVPVLIDAGEVLTRGCTIISGATAGCGKKLAAEGKPYDVIGYYAGENRTIGGSPALAPVRLALVRMES